MESHKFDLVRPKQSLYQMKPGGDFGRANDLVNVKQDSYAFSKGGQREHKRAAGGAMPMGSVNDPERAMRNSSNLPPAMRRGGAMRRHQGR